MGWLLPAGVESEEVGFVAVVDDLAEGGIDVVDVSSDELS
jgi:hypothetical protein